MNIVIDSLKNYTIIIKKNSFVVDNKYYFLKNNPILLNNSSVGIVIKYDLYCNDSFLQEVVVKIFKFSDVQNANDLYITPNAYVSYGKITLSAYEEKGASAALSVNSASVNVYEVGAGVDVYKEYLLEKFLGQEYAFWTPKASFNIIKKHYSNLETNYYFKDYPQHLIKGNNAGYDDTVVFQTKLGVDFVKNQITLKAITKFDLAPNSYYNASIMTYFKYSL